MELPLPPPFCQGYKGMGEERRGGRPGTGGERKAGHVLGLMREDVEKKEAKNREARTME